MILFRLVREINTPALLNLMERSCAGVAWEQMGVWAMMPSGRAVKDHPVYVVDGDGSATHLS